MTGMAFGRDVPIVPERILILSRPGLYRKRLYASPYMKPLALYILLCLEFLVDLLDFCYTSYNIRAFLMLDRHACGCVILLIYHTHLPAQAPKKKIPY